MIKQMSPDEAMIVQYLKDNDRIPYITLNAFLAKPRKGFVTPYEHEVSLCADVNMMYPQNIHVYLSNLQSLGIIVDANTLLLMDDSIYEKVIRANQLEQKKAEYEKIQDIERVEYKKGYYFVSEIGKLFIRACCR